MKIKNAVIKYKRILLLLFMVLALTKYISSFWFQLMLIQGESMYPAYDNWQFVVLEKHFGELESGDVIAFRCEQLKSVLVKRIVAVPGEVIQIINGKVYINDKIKIAGLSGNIISYSGTAKEPIKLHDNEYFVLGDNYEESKDSRYSEVGCVVYEDIIGRVRPQKLPD